ncbi:Subtilase family protein [Sporobacter termitidis DSM 10068]|uniref:Subtilase family protein n=1 Tax=Sporobacter termitidis DSM 10068 TaxID=1123282 RepID=A0A1M5W485_9FIRM|nr:S8 family serine peptidase [Sporobacter termitidis]SHH82285.1 Subtilase family protein [Sporobacter termitidis DSM 10068]
MIDDGVDERCFDIGKLENNIVFKKDVGERSAALRYSHGTICAAIIRKYAPNAHLSSIKVLSGEIPTGEKTDLVKALTWCLDNDVQIVHMSIGTSCFKDFDDIREIISRLYHKGTILVAAHKNRYCFSVPACLPGVIRVRHCEELKDAEYSLKKNSYYDHEIVASGNQLLHDDNSIVCPSGSCNSYAAPVITATINNIMDDPSEIRSFKAVLDALERNMPHPRQPQSEAMKPVPGSCIPYFIREATVCGATEHAELFFFRAAPIGEQTNALVYIPGQTEAGDRFLNVVEQSGKSIENIIYAGILKDTDKEYCHKNTSAVVWDESLCRKSFSPAKDKRLTIPAVGIRGDGRDVILLLRLLRKEFARNDYFAKTLSMTRRSYLYGIDYIPQNEDLIDFLITVEKLYGCDLILIGISRDQTYEDSFFDYTIDLDNAEDENSRLFASGKADAAGFIFNNIKTSFEAFDP